MGDRNIFVLIWEVSRVGQMGQTVNLLSMTSEVRILHFPPCQNDGMVDVLALEANAEMRESSSLSSDTKLC